MKNTRRQFFAITAFASLCLAATNWPLATLAAEPPAGKLKIGVIGAGKIGSTLGEVWIKAGHEVMFSSLDLEADKKLAASMGPSARAGTPRDAAAYGEVLLVSVPYSAIPQLGKELGDLIKGKTILDTSNPVASRDGEVVKKALEIGPGLATAQFLPGAFVVRGFNAIGFSQLQEFTRGQRAPAGMPIAGDDAKAIAVASRLVREAGLEPVLVGSLAMGRYLRPGTPLAGIQTPEQIRKIIPTLN
ncbi:MAG: NADPH-dependent F420 reductase [Burkholderiales bacterium]